MIDLSRAISQKNENLNYTATNKRNLMLLGVKPELLPHFAVSFGPGLINQQ
jgi:hypothetical protein